MIRYLQVSRWKVLDREEWKLVSLLDLESDNAILVPFFMREDNKMLESTVVRMVTSNGKTVTHTYIIDDFIELNGFHIAFNSRHGYERSSIKFFDKDWITLDIDCDPCLPIWQALADMKYSIYGLGGTELIHNSWFDDTNPTRKHAFEPIENLGQTGLEARGANIFVGGMSSYAYELYYRGKKLKNKLYAMICGPWAVLLTDDFRFDSFVILNSAHNWVLGIDRVVYTLNVNLMKAVCLIK